MRLAGAFAVAGVEARKAARQPSSYVLSGILLAYLALVVVAISSLLAAPAEAGMAAGGLLGPLRADAVGFVAGIASGIGVVLLVVFAAQAVAQEFTRGTLRTLLLARARRRDVVAGKLLFLLAVAALVTLVVLAAAIAGAGVFSLAAGEDLVRVDAGDLASRALRLAFSLAAWTTLAFGATLLTRSLGVGIGATLGTLLGGDVLGGLLRTWGEAGVWASRALPGAAIGAVAGPSLPPVGDWAWILPNLLLYVVGIAAFAAWRFRTMDVISETK